MNKIGWCDMTFNPVWGCRNNCPYCYARKIAKRFAENIYNKEVEYHKENYPVFGWGDKEIRPIFDFKPVFLESNFNKPFPKKPSRIFVNSMSDIAYWKPEWMKKVLNKIKDYPQHQFLFLTKNYSFYNNLNFSKNCWLGVTITNNDSLYSNPMVNQDFDFMIKDKNKIFYSLEPLQERISLDLYITPDWVIIGAETGNRKGKIIPKREWISEIVDFCKSNKIPVFLKNSLKEIWGEKTNSGIPRME